MFHYLLRIITAPSFCCAANVPFLCLKAERIMEAIELYREETAKLEQHKVICRAAGKEVGRSCGLCSVQHSVVPVSFSEHFLKISKGRRSKRVAQLFGDLTTCGVQVIYSFYMYAAFPPKNKLNARSGLQQRKQE